MRRDGPKSDSDQHRIVLPRNLDNANATLASLDAEHRAAALMTGDRRYRTLRSIEEKIRAAEEHRSKLERELQTSKALTLPLESPIFSHSTDYCSIRYKGVPYALTRNQSTIIKLLHEAYLKGTPSLRKDALLSAIEAETSRVRDSFKGSPLWGTLIVANKKPRGTVKLDLE